MNLYAVYPSDSIYRLSSRRNFGLVRDDSPEAALEQFKRMTGENSLEGFTATVITNTDSFVPFVVECAHGPTGKRDQTRWASLLASGDPLPA